jgi:hypothetical protein
MFVLNQNQLRHSEASVALRRRTLWLVFAVGFIVVSIVAGALG